MKDILRKSYNIDALNFETKFARHQLVKYNTVFLHKLAACSPEDMLLDLGCGSGLLQEYLQQNNIYSGTVFGIDFADRLLIFAQQKGVQCVCGDIFSLPCKSNIFDKVFSFTVLRIVPDQEMKILSEINRVLTGGGIFIATILRSRFDPSFVHNLQAAGFTVSEILEDCGQDIGVVSRKG